MTYIKVFIVLYLLNLSINAFNRRIDSLLITKKSFSKFAAINSSEIPTLKYQLYIKDIIPLMERNHFNVRSAFVLPRSAVKKYLDELKKKSEYKKMCDLIDIQRYSTRDSSLYYNESLEIYKNLNENQKLFLEIKNLLLKEKISYKKAKKLTKNIKVPDSFIKTEFSDYIENSMNYNRFSLYILAGIEPTHTLLSIPKLMKIDDNFLKDNIIEIIKKTKNPKVKIQIYQIIGNNLGNNIEFNILLALNKIDELKKNYTKLNYNQRIIFTDALISDMIEKEQFINIDKYTRFIKERDYTENILRYKIAKIYRSNENIYNYADTVHVRKDISQKISSELNIFQIFSKNKKIFNIYTKNNMLSLWVNLYNSINRTNKRKIHNLLKQMISLNIKSLKNSAKKLKKKSIEQKILISFLEISFYNIKYPKDDLYEWYDSMKYLKFGETLMLTSEIFFDPNDLKEFYLEKEKSENDDNWRQFLKNRIEN